MDLKLIMDPHSERSEYIDAIMRIWRGKPSSSVDAKRYYDIKECYHIEDKLEETNISKIKLPLLSNHSVKHITKEEVCEDLPKELVMLLRGSN